MAQEYKQGDTIRYRDREASHWKPAMFVCPYFKDHVVLLRLPEDDKFKESTFCTCHRNNLSQYKDQTLLIAYTDIRKALTYIQNKGTSNGSNKVDEMMRELGFDVPEYTSDE